MKRSLLMVSVLALFLGEVRLQGQDAKVELTKLHGTWRLIKEIDDGKEMAEPESKDIRLTFSKDGTWQVEASGKVVGKGTMKIDSAKKPKTIDYTFTDGDQKGMKFIAIYELDGDTYKHCGVSKGDRPM